MGGRHTFACLRATQQCGLLSMGEGLRVLGYVPHVSNVINVSGYPTRELARACPSQVACLTSPQTPSKGFLEHAGRRARHDRECLSIGLSEDSPQVASSGTQRAPQSF